MLVLSFAALACCVQTYTVPALSKSTSTVSLNQGDQVTGNINVSSVLNSNINFNITDPDGKTLEGQSYKGVTQTSFDFTAKTGGTYTFVFENPGLLSRSVSLDYTVKPAALGIPQSMLPLLIAIIATIIVVVVVVVLLAKRKKSPAA
jgi:hypothetical protein